MNKANLFTWFMQQAACIQVYEMDVNFYNSCLNLKY